MEQKRFYFDVGSNTRGVYLRISEVSTWLYLRYASDFIFTLFDETIRDSCQHIFSNVNEGIHKLPKKNQMFKFQTFIID